MNAIETGGSFLRRTVNPEILLKLLDFETSSPGIPFLERHLGIHFPEGIREAEYSLRNRLLLVVALPGVSPDQTPWTHFLLGRREKLLGQGSYNPDDNVCFNWRSDRRRLSNEYLHELLHGYTFSINARLFDQFRSDEKALDSILRGGGDASELPTLIDRRITTRFVLEGIAQWGSFEALQKGQDELSEKIDFDNLSDEHFGGGYNRKDNHEHLVRFVAGDLAMEDYLDVLKVKGLKQREKQIEKGDRLLLYFHYAHSMKFVRDVILYMESKGLSAPNALDTLIGNIPTKLGQIINPIELAEAILPSATK